MTIDPDRFILEQIFQRIVNLMAGRKTCYDLARSCLVGTGVFITLVTLFLISTGDWTSLAIMPPVWLFGVFGVWCLYQKVKLIEDEFLDGFLYDPFAIDVRLARIGFALFFLVYIYWSITGFTLIIFTSGCHLGLSASACYFMSCMPAPPRKNRKRRAWFKTLFAVPQAL